MYIYDVVPSLIRESNFPIKTINKLHSMMPPFTSLTCLPIFIPYG